MQKVKLLLCISCCVLFLHSKSQDTSRLDKLISLPDKLFGALDKKTRSIEEKLIRQTDRYLDKLQRQEVKLKKKLWKKDSSRAKEIFGDIEKRYAALRNAKVPTGRFTSFYSAHLDSLSTAMGFLETKGLVSSPESQKLLTQYKDLQLQLNVTSHIKKQLQQRQKILKDQFEILGMVKELKQFRKHVFYYQSQVKEYKEMFEDPTKLEAKLMDLARKVPEFSEFFRNNSLLGSMFALPGSPGSTPSLVGLQTRASVSQLFQERFGTGPEVMQSLRQNVQSAQSQLGNLQNRIASVSSGSIGKGDSKFPDFKPNSQKTKPFLKRLEYGMNIQSQKARYFFPITSDIGLSLGYKLNNDGVIGIGVSYKLGWGRGWEHISISHQGVGLRSYINWKLKASFYLSGGYEQNYQSLIKGIEQLKNHTAWQKSGLVGISKTYQVTKKFKGEMKILWDFLSYQQVPRTQPIIFRIGYSIK